MGKRVWKIFGLAAVFVLGFGVAAAPSLAHSTVATYRTVTEVHDWGAAIPRIIVDLGKEVKADAIAMDAFKVYVKRSIPRTPADRQAADLYKKLSPNVNDTKILGDTEGYREITGIYVADKSGKAVQQGRYAVIEMEIGPDITLGSPLNFDVKTMRNNWVQCDYTIIQEKDVPAVKGKITGLKVTKTAGNIRPDIDMFRFGAAEHDGITLHYASYEPEGSAKHPLIIWLHGMGEGGTDPAIPIAANKANRFADPVLQAYFGGAYVLVPQSPTFWMDGFQGFGDGTSKYEASLMELIKEYVAEHKNIDEDRIYIGGDSNGGYMTMLMIRDYPDYFAAAFPTCEALKDSLIRDKDIAAMKKLPIWFTAAKTDQVVPPAEYVVPTYQRLLAAGAKNVHFSFFDDVHDMTGLYKKDDGTPFEYNGHWSWIHVYNNTCASMIDGKLVTLMEWLAAQHK
ncbi:hypothetical protein P22_2115 [Propionispora sp. 2/2-37]|uniref:prolyl oligopeptidase family serine peptidase n=1 Tax=Propionispora sp. 2/2-37 TaxID=1677858 RepID=UPI0006BB8235|nr:prolyl oligopeptidase family serine peptidase [Propionispora sp. 2/2-37]CUH96027.1 hypothetical protein P22_2115 [Propionispora sp. 2/2-37]